MKLKSFNVSKSEIAELFAKHRDLLPILLNPEKTAEERLTEFSIAYLRKTGHLKTKGETNGTS
jgi:hypothetical protein